MKLIKLRQERNVSREELAVAVGVSHGTIVNFEMGRSMPRLDTARQIADYLGVSVDDIEWGAAGKPADGDSQGKDTRTAVA